MIADYLFTGVENARTGGELAKLLHCERRDISAGISRERRQGQPIIASNDKGCPGYYLAETAEEIELFCNSLERRAGEIHITRNALLHTAAQMQEGER